MTYHFVCMPDFEEGIEMTNQNVRFAATPSQVETQIRNLSVLHPTSTLCVYKLSEMSKLKSKPTYAKYKVTPEGEVVPV